MIKVIVVGWAAEGYIEWCLKSIVRQTVKDWHACVILDPSDDKTFEKAKAFESGQILVTLNEQRHYGLANTAHAVYQLNPGRDDILITVDADDWLSGPYSFETVLAAYLKQPDLLLTYGSWVSHPDETAFTNTIAPYTSQEYKNLRRSTYRASHLRSFKGRLWAAIDKKRSFLDPRGEHYRAATDLAFMWPMMEMAGYDRVQWIPERIYTHNQEATYPDSQTHTWEQCRNTAHQANLKPYEYREEL